VIVSPVLASVEYVCLYLVTQDFTNSAYDLNVKVTPCMCSYGSCLAGEMTGIHLYIHTSVPISGEDLASYLHGLAYSR